MTIPSLTRRQSYRHGFINGASSCGTDGDTARRTNTTRGATFVRHHGTGPSHEPDWPQIWSQGSALPAMRVPPGKGRGDTAHPWLRNAIPGGQPGHLLARGRDRDPELASAEPSDDGPFQVHRGCLAQVGLRPENLADEYVRGLVELRPVGASVAYGQGGPSGGLCQPVFGLEGCQLGRAGPVGRERARDCRDPRCLKRCDS